MVKRIAIFNHKGGVGKTVTAFNIGWKYTEFGKRVLLVDGDSQINLSYLTLGQSRFDGYYTENETRTNNIKDGVAPVFEARPATIDAFDCPTATNNEEIFLLPGHPELSVYEGQLSLAQETAGALSALKNLPGALSALISEVEEHHNIDVTIIDLNPGLGAINQNFFLASTSFIVPTNPDPFSAMAVKTLGDYVTRWSTWKQSNLPRLQDAEYQLPEEPARFLGSINSRFNKHATKAAKKFDERIRAIDRVVSDQLVPKLSRHGMVFRTGCYRYAFEKWSDQLGYGEEGMYALGRIPDFQSLVHYASDYELPVFKMDRDRLLKHVQGNALDNALANVQQFDAIFSAIVDKVELLFDEECCE